MKEAARRGGWSPFGLFAFSPKGKPAWAHSALSGMRAGKMQADRPFMGQEERVGRFRFDGRGRRENPVRRPSCPKYSTRGLAFAHYHVHDDAWTRSRRRARGSVPEMGVCGKTSLRVSPSDPFGRLFLAMWNCVIADGSAKMMLSATKRVGT